MSKVTSSRKPCKFYNSGFCKYDKDCLFLHSTPSSSSSDQPPEMKRFVKAVKKAAGILLPGLFRREKNNISKSNLFTRVNKNPVAPNADEPSVKTSSKETLKRKLEDDFIDDDLFRPSCIDPERAWVKCEFLEPDVSRQFSVMTYNILCNSYTSSFYPYCEMKYMRSKYRNNFILKQIKHFNPAVLSLQEVSHTDWKFWDKELELLGYITIYKRKTHNKPDGLIVAYLKTHFEYIEHEEIEFCNIPVPGLARDNVALIVALQHIKSSAPFVFVNTHITYNPSRSDLKLAQLQYLLNRIPIFADFCCLDSYGLILSGDFNITPFSPLYQFVTSGKLNVSDFLSKGNCGLSESGRISGVNNYFANDSAAALTLVKSSIKINKLSTFPNEGQGLFPLFFNSADTQSDVHHPLELKSVVTDLSTISQNHTSHQVMVDYLFYNSSIQPVEYLSLPTLSACKQKFPCKSVPSDHLFLLSRFQI